MTAQEIIELFKMQPHPEGGYYAEVYRSAGVIPATALPEGFKGARNYSTSIYFLLDGDARSKLHRLASDEIWHFYAGEPLVIAEIDPDGRTRETILGPSLKDGHKFQHVVTSGSWFGAYLMSGHGYALVGCTVAPGFDFADFEIGRREVLLQKYPQAAKLIARLA